MDTVSDTTRLVQIFLTGGSTAGVCEVSVDRKTSDLFCSCPGFAGRKTCKHVKFVKARVDSNKGTYPLELSKSVSDDDVVEAQKSPDTFRSFVIKHGVIEVL
jgi:predicted nucleic acid-binding Zn finger protein